ncbi:HK-domain-containing protein [Rhizoclosmatium globosum]|uniref:HK-domain-containing protein n=1 Tax=Rhizoclosmatium globosum TaxID=329046 RepID=A0A1Y2CKU7_9FUNG|nr:HK-domain-containing protein [Rhizoclosmatium globosum]|eukprot:ORY47649.1 HK-domain-containing protein [Rhizoclosmatium globosum]
MLQTKTVTTTTKTTTIINKAESKPLDLSVYVVIDVSVLPAGRDAVAVAEQALEGGATVIQLRAKHLDTKSFIELSNKVKAVAAKFGALFVVNDRVDVALAVDADGIHIGQDDMPLATARRLLGPSKVIGVTCSNTDEVNSAVSSGFANYLGTCAVFPTATKAYAPDFTPLGATGLNSLLQVSTLPIVAIGGINVENVEQLIIESQTALKTVAGCAVVSAIVCAQNPTQATKDLAAKIHPLLKHNSESSIARSLNPRPPRVQLLVNQVAQALSSVRASTPLVHSITNYVVMNDNANVLLAIGASPIMAHSTKEASDIISFCGSLVLNIGTLSDPWIDAMHIAGKKANSLGIPVVLDPVGAGATPLRQSTCVDLVTLIHTDIVKGNAGEISFLAGALANTSGGVQSRGVDSDGTMSEPAHVVRSLAAKVNSAIAMSGPVDYVSDRVGKDVVAVSNGNEWLGKITGTGCDTTTLVAAFAAALNAELKGKSLSAATWTASDDESFDPYLIAGVGGILCMCIAAEQAIAQGGIKGPMSFKTALFDAIANLTPEMIQRFARVDFV